MSLYDKSIGKEARASLEFAEDSRETEWLHPSYSAMLYQGEVKWNLLHPFPRQSAEDKKIGDEWLCLGMLDFKTVTSERKFLTVDRSLAVHQERGFAFRRFTLKIDREVQPGFLQQPLMGAVAEHDEHQCEPP